MDNDATTLFGICRRSIFLNSVDWGLFSRFCYCSFSLRGCQFAVWIEPTYLYISGLWFVFGINLNDDTHLLIIMSRRRSGWLCGGH